ncbi:unnamed protein product [Aphanomyces euteiches]
MKIVVVGGGIVGLSTALVLLEHGFPDVKIIADNFDDTTSHTAGALWRPFSNAQTPDRTMDKWGDDTARWLKDLLNRYGSATVGIQWTPGTELHDEPHDTHPYWAHSVRDFRFLRPDEASRYGKTYGFSYKSLLIHPGTLMAWVTKEIRARGGVFEKRTLTSLNDLDCHLVVNCSGLGARQLVGDSAVYPVRGQVIKLVNPDINQFFLSECDGHCTYILPRPGGEVILGGTVQAHNWSLENNDKDVDEIMTRCSALLPQVKNSRVLHAKTGLRPANANGTRVELDPKRTQKGAWVIHNYGHGGSGHTIHRGCAMDVVQIVKSLTSKL